MATYGLIVSGAWSDPNNWINLATDASGVPGPSDTAMFGGSFAGEVTGMGNVGTIDGSLIMNGATLTTQSIVDGGVNLQNDSDLTVQGPLSVSSDGGAIDVASGVLTTINTVTGSGIPLDGGMEVDAGGTWNANTTVSDTEVQTSGTLNAMMLSDLTSFQIGGGTATASLVSVEEYIVIQSAQVTLGDVSILGTPPDSLPAVEIYGQATVTTGSITGNASLVPFSNADLEVLGSGTSLTVDGDVSMLAALVAGQSSITGVTGNLEENQLLIGGDDTSGLPTKVGVAGNIDIGTGGTPVATTSEITAGGFLSFGGVLTVGAQAGWNNTLEVDDDTAETGDFGSTTLLPGYITGASMVIGAAGIGTLDIEDSAEVELTGTATIGDGAQPMDTLIVDGANSTLNAGSIVLSDATATIENGGQLVGPFTGGYEVQVTNDSELMLSDGTIDSPVFVEPFSVITGSGTIEGACDNEGAIVANGSLTLEDDSEGGGVFNIDPYSTLDAVSGLTDTDAGATIFFDSDGAPGTLIVPEDFSVGPEIYDFVPGDLIHVRGTDVTQFDYTQTSPSGGVLELDETPGELNSPAIFFTFAGSYTPGQFEVVTSPDGNGTDITINPACFAAGTRILTEHGEVAVENLRLGDRVVTRSRTDGAPIVWLGHRRVDCDRHPRPNDVWPVRILAEAFGPDRPHRNLLLSPDHAVFVNGVLIPIRLLVNGRSILLEPVGVIAYWHVELAEHDVILAEGLAAESYLDTGYRSAFANHDGPVMAHPVFAPCDIWEAESCAPLVQTGPALETVRRELRERAREIAGPMIRACRVRPPLPPGEPRSWSPYHPPLPPPPSRWPKHRTR